MSGSKIITKIKQLEAEKDKLHDLLEKEKRNTPEWFDIRWAIDDLIMDICDLEQKL